MEKLNIYIVEDDVFFAKVLIHQLDVNKDFEFHKFETAKEFLKNFEDSKGLVLLDYNLPDANGLDVLRKIKQKAPFCEVIVLSNQDEITKAVQILKEGAFDYIQKEDDAIKILHFSVSKAVEKIKLQKEISDLHIELGDKFAFSNYIKGNSKAIKSIHQLLEKTTNNSLTVSVTGETGTGKELVAKAIHYNSNRKKHNFVPINVAAIPKELIESELFGYEKGAFTGANFTKIGKFEEANGGTLFLDEIGEMDLMMQSKLLRVLQERELQRLGGNKTIPIDVRLVVATHKNLLEEVKKGNFREDLYYRLIGIRIALPSLIERGDDIILLANYFMKDFCLQNKIAIKEFSPEAIEKLFKYHYPGNIRELKSIVEIAVVMSDDKKIEPNHINFISELSFEPKFGGDKTLERYEIEIIEYYLQKHHGNVVNVAKMLDIGKSTIYRMIKDKKLIV